MTRREDITVSDLDIMSQATRYRDWMYRRIAPFLGRRVLEVGAGIGNFTSLLLDRELVLAVDNHEDCVARLAARLGGRLRVPPILHDVADPAFAEALRGHDLDTVICLNVLEHIPDDVAALANMRAVLVPGGRLVVLVPAFQFLYGSVDRSLEHCRRYTRRSLLPVMRRAGFEVERAFYMNVVGMAGWFFNNRVVRRREESARQIAVFDRFVAPWAEALERLVPPPVGLSLIAVGRKPAAPAHAPA